jgi:thiol:disulfide interchange protein DsbA
LVRVPVALRSSWEPHARFFYTAEVLGVADQLHGPLFKAIQEEKRKLNDKQALVAFAAEHGVNEAEFRKTWDSFPVVLKMERSKKLAASYRITGVPMVGINGKYLTGGRYAGSFPEIIETVNALIEKEGG